MTELCQLEGRVLKWQLTYFGPDLPGVWGGLTPSYQLQPPRKIPTPLEKIPTPQPQVEWHFYEIKVLEGVSDHKNS